ncbi:hypothetical protein KQI65_04345 [bacterium]|nr:hypothetical protein [bacterium]
MNSRSSAPSLILAGAYLALSLVVAFHYHAIHLHGSNAVTSVPDTHHSESLHNASNCHIAWYANSAFLGIPHRTQWSSVPRFLQLLPQIPHCRLVSLHLSGYPVRGPPFLA